jgi:hypothetical protein
LRCYYYRTENSRISLYSGRCQRRPDLGDAAPDVKLPGTAQGRCPDAPRRGYHICRRHLGESLDEHNAFQAGASVAAPKKDFAIVGQRPSDRCEIGRFVVQRPTRPLARGEIDAPWRAVGDDMNCRKVFSRLKSRRHLLSSRLSDTQHDRFNARVQVAEDCVEI